MYIEYSIIGIIIVINIISFILGYVFAKNTYNYNGVSNNINTNRNINILPNKDKIDIDQSKVILDINTDQFQKKYTNIADSQVSNDNIGNSINKLKNIKG